MHPAVEVCNKLKEFYYINIKTKSVKYFMIATHQGAANQAYVDLYQEHPFYNANIFCGSRSITDFKSG